MADMKESASCYLWANTSSGWTMSFFSEAIYRSRKNMQETRILYPLHPPPDSLQFTEVTAPGALCMSMSCILFLCVRAWLSADFQPAAFLPGRALVTGACSVYGWKAGSARELTPPPHAPSLFRRDNSEHMFPTIPQGSPAGSLSSHPEW